MGKINLNEAYIFEISIKNQFGVKIPFFRVLATIEPGRSLLTVRHHDLKIKHLKT